MVSPARTLEKKIMKATRIELATHPLVGHTALPTEPLSQH